MKFSALLALCAGNSPVPGEFPAQRPVTRSFDIFFELRLNKRLSKQSWGWWSETPSRPIWRHCNDPERPWYAGEYEEPRQEVYPEEWYQSLPQNSHIAHLFEVFLYDDKDRFSTIVHGTLLNDALEYVTIVRDDTVLFVPFFNRTD